MKPFYSDFPTIVPTVITNTNNLKNRPAEKFNVGILEEYLTKKVLDYIVKETLKYPGSKNDLDFNRN